MGYTEHVAELLHLNWVTVDMFLNNNQKIKSKTKTKQKTTTKPIKKQNNQTNLCILTHLNYKNKYKYSLTQYSCCSYLSVCFGKGVGPVSPKYLMSELNQSHRYRFTEITFPCLFSSFGYPVHNCTSFLVCAKWLHSTKMWRTVRIHWQCSHWGGGSLFEVYEWVKCMCPMRARYTQFHPSCTAWKTNANLPRPAWQNDSQPYSFHLAKWK